MKHITTIGFDADDTLWHNERYFKFTEARFVEMLGEMADAETVSARLLQAERKNLQFYGFGIKGFTLSMVETAIEITEGRVAASVIAKILEAGREMLHHPVELLPGARETLEALTGKYRLVLVTKGDLFDQERKLAQSGLGELFQAIEIVSDKTPEIYGRVFAKHGDGPERALMAGNSLKSDVLPAIEAGAIGVHVPHDLTWGYEHEEAPKHHPRFFEVADLRGVLELLR
jgi:putative hydrolase of the HAD superfamily